MFTANPGGWASQNTPVVRGEGFEPQLNSDVSFLPHELIKKIAILRRTRTRNRCEYLRGTPLNWYRYFWFNNLEAEPGRELSQRFTGKNEKR
jgi:hypothetical protein